MVKPRVKKIPIFLQHQAFSPFTSIGLFLQYRYIFNQEGGKKKKRKEKHKQEKKVKFSLQIRGVNIIPTII